MNKNNYKTAIDSLQFSEDLSEKVMEHLSSCTLQPQKDIQPIRLRNKKARIAFASVLCILLLAISVPMFKDNGGFELPNSVGDVSVKYIDKAPSVTRSESLSYRMTEVELFKEYNPEIFRGKIEDIKNIKVNFNRATNIYNAIAKVKIEKIYRGSGEVGETVSLLLPCPIDTNLWVEDTEVLSSMRAGMTGIFMPIKYDETYYYEENGAKIYWKDIVNYGFRDGVRYAFLDTGNGLIFDKGSYESIASANSLDEVEQYIMKMIK